ncbi:MAG: hypothetical protein P1V97_25615, partial [Planctomycetota bacterium]|nr:hypothetical protein [Planctomycetota bacterium]
IPHYDSPLSFEIPNFPVSTENGELKRKLQARIDVQFQNKPILDALEMLSKRCDIPFQFHESTNKVLIDGHIKTTLELRNAKAESALSLVLSEDSSLVYEIKKNAILITTHSQTATRIGFYKVDRFGERLQAYQDLHFQATAEENDGEEYPEKLDALACNHLSEWTKLKKPKANLVTILKVLLRLPKDDEHWIRRAQGQIVLKGEEADHQRCKVFLEALDENALSGKDIQIEGYSQSYSSQPDRHWNPSIQRKLNTRYERIKFPKARFTEVVAKFRVLAGLNIHIRHDVNFQTGAYPYTFNYCTVKEALESFLDHDDLQFIVHQGVLQIVPSGSKHKTSSNLDLRIMKVEDILYKNGAVNPDYQYPQYLPEFIFEMSGEENWTEDHIIAIYGGQLIIRQNKAIHRDVDKILDAIRRDIARRPKTH